MLLRLKHLHSSPRDRTVTSFWPSINLRTQYSLSLSRYCINMRLQSIPLSWRILVRHEAYHRLYFLTVARGPTVSQADRLIWPPDHIQCIDERIAVAKQRALETSNFVRYVSHTRTDIRDHRRERWRDSSIVGVVFKMRQRNHRKTSSPFWRVERYTSYKFISI